ncbi:XRE family transcriptional regulator [Vitreimonas sp.]|uniref:helix-turn-helix domain-containing protein n=1 Tax=Vitreimonas sp. TaxID=3069702 RepID=UPI002D778FFB|nr:XRE family transcriptional regulator [Vitreimonas sp.]
MDVRELRNHLTLSAPGAEPRPEAREPAAEDAPFDQASFGSAVRRLRTERGWTLKDLSERSKISQSALSRVETGQITLSFDRAHALARALDTDFSQIVDRMVTTDSPRLHPPINATGWRSVTRRGEGHRVAQNNGKYEYLCTEFLYRKMVTGFAIVTAQTLDEHGPFVTHPGEEFIHVMEGAVIVETEYYAPLTLEAGDSLQFDSMTPHAILTASREPARVLFSITDPRWE